MPAHRAAFLPLFALVPAAITVSPSPAAPVAPGFRVERLAGGGSLSYVTGLAFSSDGTLHVSEANLFTGTGRVLRVEDRDGDGAADTVATYADGFGVVTGITFRGDGFGQGQDQGQGQGQGQARGRRLESGRPATDLERIRRGQFRGQRLDLFVSHFEPGVAGSGTISVVRDRDGDGVAEFRSDIVTGLPSDGLNGNQQPAVGPDGRIYFGQGARTNAGVPSGGPPDTPLNATILRVDADGRGLEIFARGVRNSFDLAWTPDGELFATENGPDPSGPGPVGGAPDELNVILAGEHYGWPDRFGFPPEGTGTIGPVALFAPSTSTDGLALSTSDTFCGFEGDFFAAQFGSFTDPSVGRRIVRVDRRGAHGRAIAVDVFATGFGRPLDVAVGPDGDLYVADFSDQFFSPGTAAIWRISPDDADGDGIPDACER